MSAQVFWVGTSTSFRETGRAFRSWQEPDKRAPKSTDERRVRRAVELSGGNEQMNLTMKEILDRYGPTIAVVVVLAALVILMPGNGSDGSGDQATGAVAGAPLGSSGSGSGVGGATGGSVTGGSSSVGVGSSTRSAGTPGGAPIEATANFTPTEGAATVWGPEHGPGNYPAPGPDTACNPDGSMPQFSQYSPQCVPKFTGDNGGATAMGVTGDSVLLVRYRPQEDPATRATLSAIGGADDPEDVDRAAKAFVRYFNVHNETYGREVKYVTFDGTGDPASDEVNRADAVAIAEELKPFAVVHLASSSTQAFSGELAARGVICVCTTSNARGYYAETAPYVWTILPVVEEYYETITEYWAKRLKDKPAKWAGTNVRVSNDVRKFGLIYLEGVGDVISPWAKKSKEYFDQLLAEQGMQLSKAVAYTFDIQQQQQQSTNIMGQMIDAGVNVITCVCDPLYPIFLTAEATRQGYYPEWFINGVALQDTTFFGRTYDQQQWSHAYGFSPLWVFTDDKADSSGYRVYHHTEDGGFEGNGVNVWQAPVQTVFNGIHYAGPRLTPETWSQGLFLAPARGGKVNAPLVKFTPQDPGAIKDWVEVWWDANGTGNDELTKPGKGILQKAQKGVRYTLGKWPSVDPYAFTDDPSPIFVSTEKETFDHDADGHRHDDDPPCRSC